MRNNEINLQELKNGFLVQCFVAREESDETGRRQVRELESHAFNEIEDALEFIKQHFLEAKWNSPDRTL